MAIVFTYTEATNTVVVTGGTSGTPATFADFVTADRANVAWLLPMGPVSSTLDYPVRPVELRAIPVTFRIENKTAEADYIFITGTDAWGVAQTESIDVTAGNGDYVTTKRWRTITALDCSDNAAGGGIPWADGDFGCFQPIWGVIWDQGLGKYQIDCNFNIGNSVLSTYFRTSREAIVFNAGVRFVNYANATTQVGLIGGLNSSYSGSYIRTNKNASNTQWGTLLMYGSFWQLTDILETVQVQGNGFVVRDSLFQDGFSLTINATGTLSRLTFGNMQRGLIWQAAPTVTDIRVGKYQVCGTYAQLAYGGSSTELIIIDDDSKLQDIRIYNLTTDVSFINATMGWTQSWVGGAANTADILEKYSCDINVCDKDGVSISGAAVDCENTLGIAQWVAGTVTTDASGNITQQIITARKHEVGGTTTFNPFKFTISKAGYQTLVLDAITVDHPIVWHLELQRHYLEMSRDRRDFNLESRW